MKNSYSRMGIFASRNARSSQLALSLNNNLCVLYIRASTDDQKLTLEGQEYEGRQWAAAHGMTISAVFIEPGVSASKLFLKRPVARQAIEHMKAKGAAVLFVINLNRGFRDVDDMRQTVNHLVDQGLSLRISNPDIDARGGYGKFLATVLTAVDELYLSTAKDQQRRAFDQLRRSETARCQNPPYGWDMGDVIPGKFSKAGEPYRALVPNPAEQAILREIIEMYEAREMNLAAIAGELNHRGIRTKRAGQTMTRGGRPYTVSGTWKREHVQSVIAHAELA